MLQRADKFLQGINRQDPQAYRMLYTDYYRALVMYTLHFVERQDVAEDIVQELFVTMWNKQMVFLSFLSFKTYLYTSARNASLDYLKHQDVKKRYAEQWSRLQEEEKSGTYMFDDEVYRQVYQAIDSLAPQCRRIFLMAMDGKKNEEIAHELHIAIETVKTQKKRAIKHLRKQTALSISLLLFINPGLFC